MGELQHKIHQLERDMMVESAFIKHQQFLLEKDKQSTVIILLAMAASFVGGFLLARNKNALKTGYAVLTKVFSLRSNFHWLI